MSKSWEDLVFILHTINSEGKCVFQREDNQN